MKASAEQLGISGTVRRLREARALSKCPSRTAWDFRNSQAARVLARAGVFPSRTAWDFRNSQAVHSKNRPRLPLLGRTAWDFRNSQAGAKSESKRRKQLAEQLGISGTVRRAVRICSSVASSGRTAWDFRNSQAAGVLGNIPQTEGPNSLGFQEQSGGVERMRSFISRAPNSLGFQEQSGGLKDSRHSLQSSAEQLGISGTVRRKFASAASMLSPSPNSLGFQEQSGGSKAKEYRPRQ